MTIIPGFLHRGCLLSVFKKISPPPHNKTIYLPKQGVKIYIADARDRMQAMIYYFNSYEPHITDAILCNLSEGDCFFDIGASTGYFSLLAAKKVGPRGKVHAFEPLRKNYKVFQKNCSLNSCNNVKINPLLVTDKVGSITFYPPNASDEWGTGSILAGNKDEALILPSVNLEYYVKSEGIKTINLIKIDAEGSELKIINGLRPVIADVGHPKIICEVNEEWLKLADCKPCDLIDELRGIGYKIYKIGRRGITPLGNNFDRLFNIFAVH